MQIVDGPAVWSASTNGRSGTSEVARINYTDSPSPMQFDIDNVGLMHGQ